MATVMDLIAEPALREPVIRSLRQHRTLPAGEEEPGEDRLMFSGVTWDGYVALDEALGHDRSSPRLYWYDGMVEIMSTSSKHEELKKWIADLMAQYFIAKRLHAYPRGQATIKQLKDAGAEPDESWTFGERKDVPDLVLEIALTSGGLPKLEIYQRFGVPEVWFWRRNTLEVWTLDQGAYTGPHTQSRQLPELPLTKLAECAVMPEWMEAILRFREAIGQAS
jgi:Uma2 family endonuclease